MILIDTGALYALADRRDSHHGEAAEFFRLARASDTLALPVPVLVEAAHFLEARLGPKASRALWDDAVEGVFTLLGLSEEILAQARAIDRRYADARLGLVDCASLALCEQHRIGTVFTYDRRHFSVYRPSFAATLRLVP